MPPQELKLVHHHIGAWSESMKVILRAEYVSARAHCELPTLAAKLGVDLYQLYSQAHKLGLSRSIRRR